MKGVEVGELLVRIAQGDNVAFAQLYKKTARGVYAFLYTYLHNRADTEDAMQTVYLKVRKSAGHFKAGTNGRAWLLQVAKNHALSEIKKSGRESSSEILEKIPVHQSDFCVTDAMQRVLTEEEQRIVALHVLWGYKHREIAKQLNVPLGTVTSKYKRSVEKLRHALKEV